MAPINGAKMEQKNFQGSDPSLPLKTARPADLKTAINDALQHLPDTAVEMGAEKEDPTL
jgi:hypothetical protein